MESLKIIHTFKPEKFTWRFPKKYREKEIKVSFQVSEETLGQWKEGKIKGLKILLQFLEDKFGGINKFELIFTTGEDKEPFDFDEKNNVAHINLTKWTAFFKEIDKILESYKISKYYLDLYQECRSEGIKKFFSKIDAKEVMKDIDQTVFSVIERMLVDFDELGESEKTSLLKGIEHSKVGTIILEKYDKLDKSSSQTQLKSLLTKIEELSPIEIKDLINTIFTCKRGAEYFDQIRKLPQNVQSMLVSNAEKAAHFLSLYMELKSSLKRFKKLIKDRKESKEKNEKQIHAFLAENYWLLGVEYFRQVIKTDINPVGEKTSETYHSKWKIYPDFEIFKIDRSIDQCVVIELEEANDKIFAGKSLSKKALDGLFQAITYTIFQNVEEGRIAKGIAVLGATGKLTKNQKKKLSKLSNMFPSIDIKTYDDLIENAENVISFLEKYEDDKGKKLLLLPKEDK